MPGKTAVSSTFSAVPPASTGAPLLYLAQTYAPHLLQHVSATEMAANPEKRIWLQDALANLSGDATVVPPEDNGQMRRLRQQIYHAFSQEEIRILCFDLRIPYEDLLRWAYRQKLRQPARLRLAARNLARPAATAARAVRSTSGGLAGKHPKTPCCQRCCPSSNGWHNYGSLRQQSIIA
ncbi:MAG: hypothetical protein R3E31_07690 [Chloroflexota bacterium]